MNKEYIAKLRNDMVITTTSPEQKKAIGTFLAAAGEIIKDVFSDMEFDYNYPNVHYCGGHWTGTTSNLKGITFEEFLVGVYSDASVSVKLNNEYTAKYKKGSDYVEVGCQKIPVSALKELMAKIS